MNFRYVLMAITVTIALIIGHFGATRVSAKARTNVTIDVSRDVLTINPQKIEEINAELYFVPNSSEEIYSTIPNNISKFKYLGSNPHSALFFLHEYDEHIIENLSVDCLAFGNFGVAACIAPQGTNAPHVDRAHGYLKINKIKGLEKLQEELQQLNKFQIKQKNNEIKSKIKSSYIEYKKDFDQYISESPYTFAVKGIEWKKNKCKIYEYPFYLFDVDDNYNFDKSTIKIKVMNTGWFTFEYMENLNKKYEVNRADRNRQGGISFEKTKYKGKFYHKPFPDNLVFKLTPEEEQALFEDNKDIYIKTLCTVVPKKGELFNFDIIKITKLFYKKLSKEPKRPRSIGASEKLSSKPVLTIVIEKINDMPLY